MSPAEHVARLEALIQAQEDECRRLDEEAEAAQRELDRLYNEQLDWQELVLDPSSEIVPGEQG